MKFLKTRNVKTPTRGTSLSAGIDFYVPEDYGLMSVSPNESILIMSGIKVEVPKNHVLIIFNKSGIATKKQLFVGACVIDEDYQGEIGIHLINTGTQSQYISSGDKIVQGILLPIDYVPIELASDISEMWNNSQSERGEGAYGSTGDK